MKDLKVKPVIELLIVTLFQATCLSAQTSLVDASVRERFFSKAEFVAGRALSYPILSKDGAKLRVNKFGSVIRAGVVHVLNQRLSMVLRLGLEQKGLKIEALNPPPSNVIATIEDTQNYVTAGGAVRLHLNHFYADLGPYLGYVVSGTKEDKATQNGVLVSHSKTKVESASYLRRFDVGLNASVGYELPIGVRMNIVVQVQYELGLMNEHKEQGGIFYNNTLGVVGGLTFNLFNGKLK